MRKIRAPIVADNLKAMFPEIIGIHAQGENQIHLGNAAEGGMIDDFNAADYYGEFKGSYPWVNEKFKEAIEGMGYHIEWYDPGPLLAFTN